MAVPLRCCIQTSSDVGGSVAGPTFDAVIRVGARGTSDTDDRPAFRAHKLLLCARSAYFRRLFFNSWPASSTVVTTQDKADEIEIESIPLPALRLALFFVYTDALPRSVLPVLSSEAGLAECAALLDAAELLQLSGMIATIDSLVAEFIREARAHAGLFKPLVQVQQLHGLALKFSMPATQRAAADFWSRLASGSGAG